MLDHDTRWSEGQDELNMDELEDERVELQARLSSLEEQEKAASEQLWCGRGSARTLGCIDEQMQDLRAEITQVKGELAAVEMVIFVESMEYGVCPGCGAGIKYDGSCVCNPEGQYEAEQDAAYREAEAAAVPYDEGRMDSTDWRMLNAKLAHRAML